MKKLCTQAIVGHQQVTSKDVWVWFELTLTGWDFRDTVNRERDMITHANMWAALEGRSVCLRSTTHPVSVAEWARKHDADAFNPLPLWSDHLVDMQQGMAGRTPPQKRVFLGVKCLPSATSATRNILRRMNSTILLDGCADSVAKVNETMATAHARRCSAADVAWLIRRSVGLGHPSPPVPATGNWTEEDCSTLPPLDIEWDPAPFGRTVAVHGWGDDGPTTRHITTLAVGRLAEMDIPDTHTPWLQRLDQADFPIDVTMHARVESRARTRSTVRRSLNIIGAQERHYAEHGVDAPIALTSQRELALEVEESLDAGPLATRVVCWPRITVSGETADEALAHAREVKTLLEPSVEVHRVLDQVACLQATVPGEPVHSMAHPRRMPVTTVAAAAPWATSQWGDAHGMHLGVTSGTSSSSARFAPWAATEHAESGLCVVSGGLGSGKSMLMGLIAHDSVMSGATADILDPSGRLQALATTPGLAGFVDIVDLLDSDEGVLSPFGVIQDPSGTHWSGEELANRHRKAENDRRSLAVSTLKQLLPASLAGDSLTEIALMEAVGKVAPSRESSLDQVVKELSDLGSNDQEKNIHAQRVASVAEQLAKTSLGRLVFGTHQRAAEQADTRMTVFSLRGLTLPDGESGGRESDVPEVRLAEVILSNSAWMVSNRMYFGHKDSRKMIMMDEARVLRRSLTGRSLLSSVAADSRKHNTFVMVADQLAKALVDLGLAQLASTAFMGRTNDNTQQEAALQLLKLPADAGYESCLQELSSQDRSPRQFLARDRHGRVERVTVDMSHRQDLLTALDTTSSAAALAQHQAAVANAVNAGQRQTLLDVDTTEKDNAWV